MAAIPTVYIEGLPLNIICVEETQLIFDIESLFATGLLVIKDPAGGLLNSIQRGTEVKILYETANGSSVIYHPMRVLSYEKIGTREAATIDRIRAVLISDWYYQQITSTKAFFGTVSQIIENALSNDRWFKKKRIEKSTDSTRIRYQLDQTSAELLNCIKKYAVSNGSAMHLFTNRHRELRLLSRATIKGETPKYRITPFLDVKSRERASSGRPELYAMALTFYSEGQNIGSREDFKISTRNVTLQDQMSSTPFLSFEAAELKNTEGVSWPTPSKTTLMDWTLSPAESAAIATNAVALKDYNTFYCVAVATNVLESSLDVGNSIEVDLNRECAENGIYFVKHMAIIYNNGQTFAKLMLCRR